MRAERLISPATPLSQAFLGLRPEALRPRLATGLPLSNLDPKLNRIADAKRSRQLSNTSRAFAAKRRGSTTSQAQASPCADSHPTAARLLNLWSRNAPRE